MTGRRERAKRRNRLALIEATLDAVAEKGVAGTTVTEIAHRSGLSRGMVHLHFGGKDALIDAAARYSSEQYFAGLGSLTGFGFGHAARRIEAIVRNDLSEQTLNERTVRLWYAFRGEARRRPAIAAYSDTRNARLRKMVFGAFAQIARGADQRTRQRTGPGTADGTDHAPCAELARDATNALIALLEGMWADFFLHPEEFRREEALRATFRMLQGLFPEHFDLDGAREA